MVAGLLHRPLVGGMNDLVERRFVDGALVGINPNLSLG